MGSVKRKAPPKEVVQLMEKVKQQLVAFKKPVIWEESTIWEQPWRFRKEIEVDLSVEEYRKMDPFWLSTMTGKFAGRKVERINRQPGAAEEDGV